MLTFHLALVLKYHVHTFTTNQLIFITEAELPVPKPDMMLNRLNQTNMAMSFLSTLILSYNNLELPNYRFLRALATNN